MNVIPERIIFVSRGITVYAYVRSQNYEKRLLASSCLPSILMEQLSSNWTEFREI